MKKQDKKLVMFVGKTHSGKTTLAKKIEAAQPELLILEADPIALFLKDTFPALAKIDDTEHTGAFKNTSLKYKAFLLLVEFALSSGRTVLLSNSNMWKKGRQFLFKLAQKFEYKTICVYFDYPEEILFERAKESKRNTQVLRVSKSFEDLIIKQRTRMEIPNPKDFDLFLHIKSEADLSLVEQKLLKLL